MCGPRRWGAGERLGGLRPASRFGSAARGASPGSPRADVLLPGDLGCGLPAARAWWAQPPPQVHPQPRCALYRGTGDGEFSRSPHSRARTHLPGAVTDLASSSVKLPEGEAVWARQPTPAAEGHAGTLRLFSAGGSLTLPRGGGAVPGAGRRQPGRVRVA